MTRCNLLLRLSFVVISYNNNLGLNSLIIHLCSGDDSNVQSLGMLLICLTLNIKIGLLIMAHSVICPIRVVSSLVSAKPEVLVIFQSVAVCIFFSVKLVWIFISLKRNCVDYLFIHAVATLLLLALSISVISQILTLYYLVLCCLSIWSKVYELEYYYINRINSAILCVIFDF